MTMIPLTPDLETALSVQAERRSLSLNEMVQQLLRDKLVELEQEAVETHDEHKEEEGTLADLFAGRTGLVSGNGTVSARKTGDQFAAYLVEKYRAGNL